MRHKIWMRSPHAGGRRSPTQSGKRQSNASVRTPRSVMLASSLDWAFDFVERSATSTPTSSPSHLPVNSFVFSRRHAISTSTACVTFPSTSVGSDTSGPRRPGAWRSTPTVTNAMSHAHSPTAPSTGLLKRRSKSVQPTCARVEDGQRLRPGSGRLPNITLQRSGARVARAGR